MRNWHFCSCVADVCLLYGRGILLPSGRGRDPRSWRGPLEYLGTITFNASSSIWRNATSPSDSNISGILRPADSTITSSRSIKGQQSSCESFLPTLLLPHPMNPVNDIIINMLNSLRCVPKVWKRHFATPG